MSGFEIGYSRPMLLFFVILSACTIGESTSDAEQGRAYTEALVRIASDPRQASAVCAPLTAPALRGDCLTAAAEALASDAVAEAEALCAQIDPADAGLQHDECWFMVAERAARPALCQQAGRFAFDCRMHILQQRIATAEDAAVPAVLAELGFETDDERPWTLIYRHQLRRRPLDLGPCAAEPSPRRAWCRRAGVGLLHDRLNHARDTQKLEPWCASGGPLPVGARYVSDPELDDALAQRTDLCR